MISFSAIAYQIFQSFGLNHVLPSVGHTALWLCLLKSNQKLLGICRELKAISQQQQRWQAKEEENKTIKQI